MTVSISGSLGVTFPDSSLQTGAASPYVNKNRLINGDMRVDQRNAGASVTPTAGQYTLDRWRSALSQTGKYSVQQSSTAPTGFINSALITSLSAYSVGASETFRFEQFVEGFNAADLGWGTANAQTVTLSFWVRSSLTGTFGGAFLNSAENRSYPFSYTISSANTWEQKSITITGDTSGTWLTNNGIGIRVSFSLGAGSTVSGTASSWSGNFYTSSTGATSVVGTNGATWYVTGTQLEIGSSATPFERRLYNQELANCQRYYEQIIVGNMQIPGGSGSAMINPISFHVQKRATPTMATITAATTNGSATVQLNGVSVNNWGLQFINNSTTSNFFTNSPVYSASIEL